MVDPFDQEYEDIREEVRRRHGAAAKDEFSWIGPGDLGQTLPPIAWTCRELRIAPGAVTCVAGYGYSGKTLALHSLLLSVAFGLRLWGVWRVEQGDVCYLDYEQGMRLCLERYQRLASGLGVDLKALGPTAIRHASLPRIYLNGKGAEDALCRFVDGARVAVIDSIRAGLPGVDENESSVRQWLDMLARVSERTGCTIIVIHHVGKGEDSERKDLRQALRGSSALFDACQTVYLLQSKKDMPIRVSLEKDRLWGAKTEPFGLMFTDVGDVDPETNRTAGVLVRHVAGEELQGPNAAESARRGILTLLHYNPGKYKTKTMVCETVGGKTKVVYAAFGELLARGEIIDAGGWRLTSQVGGK